jgi:hypothetical protein
VKNSFSSIVQRKNITFKCLQAKVANFIRKSIFRNFYRDGYCGQLVSFASSIFLFTFLRFYYQHFFIPPQNEINSEVSLPMVSDPI